METQPVIVAEVSKSWTNGQAFTETISQIFEKVCVTNYQRGYVLQSWKFNQVATPDGLVETIIAVFTKS